MRFRGGWDLGRRDRRRRCSRSDRRGREVDTGGQRIVGVWVSVNRQRHLKGQGNWVYITIFQPFQPLFGVFDSIEGLTPCVGGKPLTPTSPAVGRDNLLPVVEVHTMLEAHVSLINHLNPRPAGAHHPYSGRKQASDEKNGAQTSDRTSLHRGLSLTSLEHNGNRFTKRVERWAVGAMRGRVFTGLVTAVGVLSNRHPTVQGLRLEVELAECPKLELGESIAVNGVCLTVAALRGGGFEADVSAETAERTTLSRLTIGSRLNLERALRLGDRLGGHWVTGHVDLRTRLLGRSTVGESERMLFALSPSLAAYVAPKGSVALDGVSLTVNEIEPAGFAVMLVPHTQRHTTLVNLRPGSEANLEIDVLARYVVHALSAGSGALGAEEGSAGLLAALARAQILTP